MQRQFFKKTPLDSEMKEVIWRKKHHIDIAKSITDSSIRYTIKGIRRENGNPDDWDDPLVIKSFLHKITITTNFDNCSNAYEKLKLLFGNFYLDKAFRPDDRMPNYGKRFIKNMPDFDIYYFTFPIVFVAPGLIEIHPKENTSPKQYRELLHTLSNSLRGLIVSSVEYTFDIYCHDRYSLQRLFHQIRRHLYVPYNRKVSRYRQKMNSDYIVTTNEILRLGNVKVYERGPDAKKRKKYWHIDDCDRVRLELSAARKILRQHKISTVDDFLMNTKFQEINQGLYNFKCFEGSARLPQCWKAYESSDEYGNKNCLQNEINNFRHQIPNINQYLKNVKAFDPLKDALLDAMISFDKAWHD